MAQKKRKTARLRAQAQGAQEAGTEVRSQARQERQDAKRE
jgi:hypothetical protein